MPRKPSAETQNKSLRAEVAKLKKELDLCQAAFKAEREEVKMLLKDNERQHREIASLNAERATLLQIMKTLSERGS